MNKETNNWFTAVGTQRPGKVDKTANPEAKLVDKFGQLRQAFKKFSRTGGVFIFAVVLDMTTWLYFSACTVLFN